MVVNEKALISCMKEAYKNQGYTVAVHDSWMLIAAGYWAVKIAEEETSNELRSLITLHMRQVPEEGTAYKTIKTKNGPFVQKMLLEDATGIEEIIGNLLDENDSSHTQMKRADMYLRNRGVWQNVEDLSIILVDPRYEALISKPLDVIKAGHGLFLDDDISWLWVGAVRDTEAKDKIEHLAKIRWVGE